MYSLGRWSEGVTRPLLVSFKSMDMKESVVANLAKLKQTVDKFKGIGISHDITHSKGTTGKEGYDRRG